MALPHLSLFNYIELKNGDFEPYQAEGIERMLATPKLIVADETGLGKTIEVLGAIASLAETDGIPTSFEGRVLIAVPASLLAQWELQGERFLPSLSVEVVTARVLGRKTGTDCEFPQIELVSYNMLQKHVADFVKRRYSTVVLDEAALIKAEGPRHDAIMRIAKEASRIYVVSATLLENHPMELYALLKAMQVPGLPPSRQSWANQFVEFEPGFQYTPKYGGAMRTVDPKPIGIKPGSEVALRKLIGPYLLRRTAEEVGLPLPRVVREVVSVPLLPAQVRAYERGQRILAPARRHAAMATACEAAEGESCKADWVVEWCRAHPGKKVVVMAEHTALLWQAEGRLTDAGIGSVTVDGGTKQSDRKNVVATFATDESVQVLLGSEVLERGFDGLQYVTDTLITIGSGFNPASIKQAEGRLKRWGSPFSTVYHLLVITDTEHERKKLQTLDGKNSQAALVFGEVPSTFTAPAAEAAIAAVVDEFVALNDGWTAEDVAHLAAAAASPAELEAELVRLATDNGSSPIH